MTTTTKWAVGVAVLVLAAIVALLPWLRASPAPSPTADLGSARVRAALAACPSGTGLPKGPFEGVTTQCLGTGAPLDLGRALAGRTTLLNVWATWCQPCRTELPVLDAYAREPGAVGVLAVQAWSQAADGLDLLAELGVHLPAAFDGDGESGPVRAALKVPPSLPASYVVSPDGRVRFISNPRTFGDTAQVRAAVRGS